MSTPPLSYLNLGNVAAIEALYKQYRVDVSSVDPSWRYFFEGMSFAHLQGSELPIYRLIVAYRQFGHLLASSNPLSSLPSMPPQLQLEAFGLSTSDLSKLYPTLGLLKEKEAPLQVIIDTLRKIYCGSLGIEYMHIDCGNLKQWIQEKVETAAPPVASEVEILQQLTQAELFEQFIHMRYPGQKRFSLEGAETLIPLLHTLIDESAAQAMNECVLGMAHRGRLNVLAHILKKPYALLFQEFESPPPLEGSGDVKYHKGFATKLSIRNQSIGLTLMANPSHLESVDPVMEGFCRGRQDQKVSALPILIHGDAALAGQGVVYETLQLSRLKGYSTGGTIHIIINNQIGFTTSPQDSRSTTYCTDIAKAFNAPIFHVNAEDPLSAAYIARLSVQIRNQFGCDVFIDLNGYRKYGHNESDEPVFTQPLEYATIRAKPGVRTLFKNQLLQEKKITESEIAAFEENLKASFLLPPAPLPLPPKPSAKSIDTAISADTCQELLQQLKKVPSGFALHPKVQRLLQEKQEVIDWGLGELLAYASLLTANIPIRLSGQDVGRGTFSHRHALWVDQNTGAPYFPLNHLKEGQAVFTAFNSPLSEFAVLGFDFGYSLSSPQTLTLWEAQFGDFANGAQVIIDQYIASCEQKWGMHTALTLLLPHGYEGQGPEHSSARMERFLQLAGDENMRIVNPTTPAQLFHILRFQALNSIQKPLVLFTPKALLRHPQCISPLSDFSKGKFHPFLSDPNPPTHPKKTLLCSGKIYYELLAEREKRKNNTCQLVRLEQLYPLPQLPSFNTPLYFVQEEPKNMGAFEYLHAQIPSLSYIGRAASASPATGSSIRHAEELEQIMKQAFEVNDGN